MPIEQRGFRPCRRLLFALSLVAVVSLSFAITSAAQAAAPKPPAPPTGLQAMDAPDDVGHAIRLKWKISADDAENGGPRRVLEYEILRQGPGEKVYKKIDTRSYGAAEYTDGNCERGQEYWYQVIAVAPDGARSAAASAGPAVPVLQYVNWARRWFALMLLAVCLSVVYFIQRAKAGHDLKIRKIAGLDAVDDAVGRATEMGRSCLFVPGIQDMNEIQTVAGITILARVAKKAAEYNAKVEVPTSRSLVMTVARETVQSAFLAAGRPDAYNEDSIYYLTDEQFGYVAGVTGKMLREKPAACFYMGAFYAESLFLAETGNAIGAIQLAGTAEPAQLPFFVAACDYTLIGEEFFAASAYLSGEPHQLGSLKGQDVGKLIGAALIVVCCALATVTSVMPRATAVGAVLNYVKTEVLR